MCAGAKDTKGDEAVILTPRQIENFINYSREAGYIDIDSVDGRLGEYGSDDVLDTLASYAEVLQKVAEMNWPGVASGGDFDYCFFCGGGATRDWALQDPVKSLDHDPDCPYVKARKLLGLD